MKNVNNLVRQHHAKQQFWREVNENVSGKVFANIWIQVRIVKAQLIDTAYERAKRNVL